MQRSEVFYLVAVAVFALVFAGLTLSHARQAFSRLAAPAPAAGTAGKPREVDLALIRRLIRERHLSGHEAEFYKRVPPSGTDKARPGDKAPGRKGRPGRKGPPGEKGRPGRKAR